ncbi:MAG: biotin/lipoate A/B protein ligase family protein [Bacteroidales bacterium]
MSCSEVYNLQYDLPDIDVLKDNKDFSFKLWRPDSRYIVLGRANSIERSVNTHNLIEDSVRIVKRPSGGESVILTPQMLVFSAKMNFRKYRNPAVVFKEINSHLIDSLSKIGIKNLDSRGISDISIGNKKIIGSSMHLNGNQLFYHAVLNINEDVKYISMYLKHPVKEPDYRMGRPHDEFVTSIYKEGYIIDFETIGVAISLAFSNLFTHFNNNIN